MARPNGNWIPVGVDLPDHFKLLGLAELLGLDSLIAMAHMISFWFWCFKYAPDGKLTRFTPVVIARAARFTGDPDAFFQALVANGFVDEVDGELVVHDWFDHGGTLHRMRAYEAEKKAGQRRGHGMRSPGPDARSGELSPGHPRLHDKTREDTTGEERTTTGARTAIVGDEPQSGGERKKEPKVYSPEVIELVEHLARYVEQVNDRKPKLKERLWHQEIERLLRIDEWSAEEARRVMDHAFTDRFWRARVQNGAKFREFFQTIRAQMRQAEPKLAVLPGGPTVT
ncbi:MAG: hypothetical protein ACLGIN_12805, partial [Candidatus Sericytochromatia bacterium]